MLDTRGIIFTNTWNIKKLSYFKKKIENIVSYFITFLLFLTNYFS